MASDQESTDILIVGFGSQAKAWALNLLDSKRSFLIALNPNSKSFASVKELGMKAISLDDPKISNYSTFVLLIPDDQHKSFFEKNINQLKTGSHFIYAHGYSLSRFNFIKTYSQFTHSLLAPKAIASDVRFQFETKGKIGAIIYSEIEKNKTFLKILAKDLGFTSLYENHYDDETTADLFSEQSILCSLIPYASLKSFNLLIANGISKELAFMECFLELKSISQAFVNLGPEAFFNLISPNALIGSEVGRELLVGKYFDEALEKIFKDIKNKDFYKTLDLDHSKTREMIIDRWKNEAFTQTYKKLKPELIS